MRERAPLWLRLKARWCRCGCHVARTPDPDAFFDDDWGGTPTHHGEACCSRFVGTVNRGWSGWRFAR